MEDVQLHSNDLATESEAQLDKASLLSNSLPLHRHRSAFTYLTGGMNSGAPSVEIVVELLNEKGIPARGADSGACE